jgi:hypothetical protein
LQPTFRGWTLDSTREESIGFVIQIGKQDGRAIIGAMSRKAKQKVSRELLRFWILDFGF